MVVLGQFAKNDEKLTSNQNSNTSAIASATAGNIEHETSGETKIKEELNREIAGLNQPYDTKAYSGSVESLQLEVVLFSVWANTIEKGQKSLDKENNKLAATLKAKVIERQVKEFPRMRQNYGKEAAKKLWESNIYVSTEGRGNTILNLTGGLFANNKNIAETQRTLFAIFTDFRFKEVRFRCYKNAEEFTCYKLDTPKDNQILFITE